MQARYSGRIDALVQQLAETARAHSGAAMSVCALGGYGRRSLCLHSDIDLLILFEDAMSPSEERFVGALLQPLWDLGLTVGQHVREISDFAEFDLGNAEFLLALLDVRFIAGDERLFQRLEAWVRGLAADNRRRAARCAAAARRRAAHAVQQHGLPAGAGHQERAGRAARHRGHAAHPAAEAGRRRGGARPCRASAAGRRGVLPAGPLDPAPREQPRRERADPRAAGEGRRDVRLRGPAVAAARGNADGGVFPPRASLVAGVRPARGARRFRRPG